MTLSTTKLEILYAYGAASSTELGVSYEYVADVPSTSELGVVYRYNKDPDTLRWPRQSQFWAWSTQEIGNLFPRWNAARLDPGGLTQSLVNSWAVNVDRVKMDYARFRRDLFLETAELEQPDLFYYAPIAEYEGGGKSRRNALRNPGFSIRGLARQNKPVFWTTQGNVTLVTAPVFIGSYSCRMHAAAAETCEVRQDFVGVVAKGRSLTASLWYMCPIPESTVTADETVAKLMMTIMYADGSVDVQSTPLLIGTGGAWHRVHVSHAMTAEVYKVRFAVYVNNTTSNPLRFYLGGAQLESAASPSPWADSSRTAMPYIEDNIFTSSPVDLYVDEGSASTTEEVISGLPVTYTARSGRFLQYVERFHTLWYDVPPTRATTTVVPVQTELPRTSLITSLGWYCTPEGERWTTNWRIASNKIEQYNARITKETIASFDIGEFWLDEQGPAEVGIMTATEDSGFSRTLEALCIYKGWLWVVCKETYNGSTIRVLKVLNPHSAWPLPISYDQQLEYMHLECIGDVDIGLASGTASYLAPSEANPDQFLIKIDDTYYTIDLEFDYCMVAYREAQAILRHNYDGTLVTL